MFPSFLFPNVISLLVQNAHQQFLDFHVFESIPWFPLGHASNEHEQFLEVDGLMRLPQLDQAEHPLEVPLGVQPVSLFPLDPFAFEQVALGRKVLGLVQPVRPEHPLAREPAEDDRMLVYTLPHRTRLEGVVAEQHLQQDHPQTLDIRCAVEGLREEQLGRALVERARADNVLAPVGSD